MKCSEVRLTPTHSSTHTKSDVLPDVLDGDTAVSLLAPDGERVDQQDDELSVLHTDGNHLSVGTVRGALGRMAQTHLVQKFLTQKTRQQHM